MTIVIDASVALKWVLEEAGLDAADALLDQDLIAPSLWLVEAANLAHDLGHPVYDCLYLAMALRGNTYVITADVRFHGAVQSLPALRNAVRLLDG